MQFLDKVVLERAGGQHRQGCRRSGDHAAASSCGGVHRQGRRCASGHAETFSACVVYEGFWKNFSIFYVRCRPLWKSGTLFLRALCSGSLSSRSCVSPRKLLDEFHSIFLLRRWTRILRSILRLFPKLFAQGNLYNISRAA